MLLSYYIVKHKALSSMTHKAITIKHSKNLKRLLKKCFIDMTYTPSMFFLCVLVGKVMQLVVILCLRIIVAHDSFYNVCIYLKN